MTKLRLASIFVAGAVTGAVPMQIAKVLGVAEAAGVSVEVQNFSLAKGTKLVTDNHKDGGVTTHQEPIWFGRACGFTTLGDGGRTDSCWEVKIDDTLAPVTSKLLDQKP